MSSTGGPSRQSPLRTYLTLLDVSDAAGNRRTYGARNAETGRRPTAPVIRILGVEAGFTRESYVPGDTATLAVESDSSALSLQVFRAGPEDVPTYNDTLMNGVPVTDPVNVGWSSLDKPGTIAVPIGAWASGLYFAKLTDEDGRIGFAPFVLRPAQLGLSRVAVILPTNTWQAYNFRDENGNGWGDTWYAKGSQSTVRLGRAFLRRGVPPQYRKYDLGFLRWLAQRGKQPDYLSETDLEVLNGDTLARLYDLVIFGGHTEYVTPREFDAVERYPRPRRQPHVPLGQQLLLAGTAPGRNPDANTQMARHRPPRSRGARRAVPWKRRRADPAAVHRAGGHDGAMALCRHGSVGRRRVRPGARGLRDRDRRNDRGEPARHDRRRGDPRDLRAGFTAQMTYYETVEGAKVFAAGALDFGGTALLPVVSRMLENLWVRLAAP